MPDSPALAGPSFGPAAGDEARELVILLHGVGADGADLIGLAPHWAHALPHAVFVSPHAPYAFDMAPMGRQWFSLTDVDPQALLAGVRRAAPALDAFIDAALEDRGLGPDRLALVGFSQGTMMALHVGLRRAEAVACIVGYSGALIGPETLDRELRSRPPVLLVHGDQDPVVPPQALPAAAAALEAQGVAVETHVRPGLGHGIDGEGLALGGRFLERAFGG
ncbi:MAG: dienelactone hydrolase family protein [Alphaproteobacteria bacterium]